MVLFLQQLYRKRPGMTMLCAKLPQNVSKNRYRDISPCTSLSIMMPSNNNMSHLIPSVTYFISSLPFVLLLGEETLFFFLSSVILPLAMRAVLPPFVVSLSPSLDDATRVILKSTDDYINANYINVSWLLLCSLFHLSVNISVLRLRPGGWSAVRTLNTHVERLRWPQWWMSGPHQPCKHISRGVKCVSLFKLTGACEFEGVVLLGENMSFFLIYIISFLSVSIWLSNHLLNLQ